MSKIICDVCGTSYPDTATQCPICGCVRPGDAQSVAGSNSDTAESANTYTYVKGGRFSKTNVRKRNKANMVSVNTASDLPVNEKEKNNTGLVIAAVVLLLAIIAVVVYIAVYYFLPGALPNRADPQSTTNSQATLDTTLGTIPCEGIVLDVDTIILDAEGAARMLYATVEPASTTDEVIFTSDNESVVTVSADGKVTAVAPGYATVTVTCGGFRAECAVVCSFELPTQESTEATTEATTEPETVPAEDFKLNRKDITFTYKGESWTIYSGSIGLTAIKWESDNDAVATIEGGKVVAVGSGTTNVHATYNGQKVSCIIRCSFKDDNPVSGSSGGVSEDGGGVSEDGGGVSEDGGSADTAGTYKLYNPYGNAEDVTVAAGRSFSLQLVDGSGNAVTDAAWSSGDESCCTVSAGTITAVAAGSTTVTATYGGKTYSCIVRVSG